MDACLCLPSAVRVCGVSFYLQAVPLSLYCASATLAMLLRCSVAIAAEVLIAHCTFAELDCGSTP